MTSTGVIRRKRDADDYDRSEIDIMNKDDPVSQEGSGQTSPDGTIPQTSEKEVSGGSLLTSPSGTQSGV